MTRRVTFRLALLFFGGLDVGVFWRPVQRKSEFRLQGNLI